MQGHGTGRDSGNILWIAWALHVDAYALIALQVGLFASNVRGVRKNDPELQRS